MPVQSKMIFYYKYYYNWVYISECKRSFNAYCFFFKSYFKWRNVTFTNENKKDKRLSNQLFRVWNSKSWMILLAKGLILVAKRIFPLNLQHFILLKRFFSYTESFKSLYYWSLIFLLSSENTLLIFTDTLSFNSCCILACSAVRWYS